MNAWHYLVSVTSAFGFVAFWWIAWIRLTGQ